MKLYDDKNISNIAQSSGKFMYRPKSQKPSGAKINKKKSSLFSAPTTIFDEEPIEFNDLDSNILNRNMIKYLPTDSIRLELQLERAENRLKKVDDEIESSELLKIEESSRKEFLEKKKKQLLTEINFCKSEYRDLGLIYKIADTASDLRIQLTEKIDNLKNIIVSQPVFKKLLEKIPGYKEKQKIKMMNMLQKQIFTEINKNTKSDPKKLEYLFSVKEELES